jgi:two-component system, NarL family, sensor histidine kinase DesK
MKMLARILQPRGLLVAMHLPYMAFLLARAITGLGFDSAGNRWSVLPLVLTATAIQVRHSLAAADGVRPRHWQWTLFLLFVITWLSAPLFMHRLLSLQWFLIASLLMLLPGRMALAAAATDAVALAVWLAATDTVTSGPSQLAWGVLSDMVIFVAGSASLFGAARLVWLAKEFRVTRTQLADLAIERERLRISRDLHDLLGHSLSAVALKGDLAQRLLERQEVSRAEAEIESIVSLARSAFRDLREITHREPAVSLSSELDRCTDILAAVGVETEITRRVERLPPKVDELFAWAVREGVTNVVRHSSAHTCSIFIGPGDGQLRLEIENDGAGMASVDGQGLSDLAMRSAELFGKARGQTTGAGRFVLTVDVPGEAL